MKHSKHFLAALLVLVLLLTISGCGALSATEAPTDKGDDLVVSSDLVGFEEIVSFADDNITYIYYRCRTTNVMYIWRESSGLNGYSYAGFTAMPDPKTNGPLAYENWLAYLEANSEAPHEQP